MGHFEQKYMYPYIQGKWLTYLTYMNIIWTETKNKLDQFQNNLNKKRPSIKSHNNVLRNYIAFLNTNIYLHDGNLYTKIYKKENDQEHYLQIKSDHPNP